MTAAEYTHLRITRQIVNTQMFIWVVEDEERFKEGKKTIKCLSRLIREYEAGQI